MRCVRRWVTVTTGVRCRRRYTYGSGMDMLVAPRDARGSRPFRNWASISFQQLVTASQSLTASSCSNTSLVTSADAIERLHQDGVSGTPSKALMFRAKAVGFSVTSAMGDDAAADRVVQNGDGRLNGGQILLLLVSGTS